MTSPTRMAWYEDWFDQDAYELVYRHRDERDAEPVIDLLEQAVRPRPGSRILDVACGRGRHARLLARRGYDVTGIDLSAHAIEQARARTRARGLTATFLRADMRTPLCEACFDGAINLFTAFGYFEDDADHQRAIDAIATMLRPGGWFFQDFLNAPHVRATLVPEDVRTEDGYTIRQRRWIADGRIEKEIRLRLNGHEHTFRESVRLLTLDDFRAFYDRAGLELVQTFGAYDGRPYTPDAPRLILHARKRNRA